MMTMIHSYIFDLEYKFSYAALIQEKKVGHRYSIFNTGGQKDTRSLPGHTGFWNLARLQTLVYSCFLGNSPGMKKIPILIIKSQ